MKKYLLLIVLCLLIGCKTTKNITIKNEHKITKQSSAYKQGDYTDAFSLKNQFYKEKTINKQVKIGTITYHFTHYQICLLTAKSKKVAKLFGFKVNRVYPVFYLFYDLVNNSSYTVYNPIKEIKMNTNTQEAISSNLLLSRNIPSVLIGSIKQSGYCGFVLDNIDQLNAVQIEIPSSGVLSSPSIMENNGQSTHFSISIK